MPDRRLSCNFNFAIDVGAYVDLVLHYHGLIISTQPEQGLLSSDSQPTFRQVDRALAPKQKERFSYKFHHNKSPENACFQGYLAFPGRFELPAFRLGGGRSIRLSYGNICNLSRTVRSPCFCQFCFAGCQIGCHFGQSPIVAVKIVRDLGLFPRSSSVRANA